jgi:hypothetical protein
MAASFMEFTPDSSEFRDLQNKRYSTAGECAAARAYTPNRDGCGYRIRWPIVTVDVTR